MNRMNLSNLAKHGKFLFMQNSPQILTGFGITGMFVAGIMAVRATPKALNLIHEEVLERTDCELQLNIEDLPEMVSGRDVIALTWKCYIPSFLTGAVSAACIIGAQSINLRRNAALATAYSLSETALKEYQEKVKATIGEKKEQVIHEEIAKDRLEKNSVKNSEVLVTGKGTTLCYDCISGRYFESDIEKVKQVVNEINYRLRSEMYISLNEFYHELGLRPVKLGEDLGWNMDDGVIDVHFSAHIADDGRPCLVVDYYIAPRYDFRKLY